jgi:hypothetical protein
MKTQDRQTSRSAGLVASLHRKGGDWDEMLTSCFLDDLERGFVGARTESRIQLMWSRSNRSLFSCVWVITFARGEPSRWQLLRAISKVRVHDVPPFRSPLLPRSSHGPNTKPTRFHRNAMHRGYKLDGRGTRSTAFESQDSIMGPISAHNRKQEQGQKLGAGPSLSSWHRRHKSLFAADLFVT